MVALYNVVFFLVISSGIFLTIFGMAKKLLWLVAIGVNIAALPLAFFIGVMATDAPDSTTLDFIKSFMFIQGVPLLFLIFTIVFSLARFNILRNK